MPAKPAVYERATEYLVTAVPPEHQDHPDAFFYAIRVASRGSGKWAVTDGLNCLNKSGGWSYESQPSSRTDRFIQAYRHDFDTAMKLARKAALKRTINGRTVTDFITRCEQRKAERERATAANPATT